MTRDGVPPAAGSASAAAVAAGDGPRRCSQCGHHGHNSRTCTSRPVKLFGVRIGDKPIRRSASMGNIAHLAAEGSGGGGSWEEGYGSDGERPHKKRGEAWTEEEHKKFLLGLNKLGKGDWRGISRNYVISRTPTQVASHAQKYFNRQTNVHRRKRRSSLFDMVIDDSSDQLPLSRSSSQEVEQQHLDDPQPVAALPAPVVSPATVVPPSVPVEVPASVQPPVQVPVPVSAPVMTSQPMEQDSVASSSSAGEAGVVMPGAMTPYLYPMMIPPPYYHPAFVPVPCYGYVPFYYGPPGAAEAPHEVVKPVAVHSTPPLNVKDLYNMSELSLKGDSDANSGVPFSPQPPKPIGRPERQSAFHGKGPSNGSSGGLIPASVVASLASDRNVWDAVLKNEKVMEFYKTHQETLVQTFPEEAATVELPGKFEDATSETASNSELPTGSPFSDFVDNAKKRVMDVVHNITDFFKDLFGDAAKAQAGAGPSATEMAVGGSFMALAIAVILVVLFKRA